MNTEAYLQFRLPKINPIVWNIPFSCLIMGVSFEKWRHFQIVSALVMESMKMEFLKMENLLCHLYLFRGKQSPCDFLSALGTALLCWTLTADSSRCSSTHDTQVVISSFPSWPGGLKAFLNKENANVVDIKAEPQAHSCVLICPGHHVDLFLWICKGRYSFVLYPLDLPCRLHTNCHPCNGDIRQSLPALVGFFGK